MRDYAPHRVEDNAHLRVGKIEDGPAALRSLYPWIRSGTSGDVHGHMGADQGSARARL